MIWGFWVGCTNIDIKALQENLGFLIGKIGQNKSN
jgi:hypothetical protein